MNYRDITHPDGRLWYSFEREGSRITEFAVQLECWSEGDWKQVARFDHDPETHDIRKEGLHMDVYREGEKHHVERDFPRLNPNAGMNFSISYLQAHNERLIERYKSWLNK
jgi:hypothetical protein